jgi:dolichyl-phosphate beta-glucosyltransferase
MNPRTLSLVVPVFNEERRIARLLETLRTSVREEAEAAGLELLEVIVVDDGSTDRTRVLATEGIRGNRRLHPLVSHEHNRGKGAAVATGIRATSGDLVLVADADIATPFTELRKLHEAHGEGAEFVIASRGLEGSEVKGAPRSRFVIGRAFNLIVRVLTGLPFRDTQCGFKLLHGSSARELARRQLVPGFAYDVELLMRARAAGLSIAEVPVRYRHGAHSTVSPLRAAPRMLFDVLRLAVRLPRARGDGRPLQ